MYPYSHNEGTEGKEPIRWVMCSPTPVRDSHVVLLGHPMLLALETQCLQLDLQGKCLKSKGKVFFWVGLLDLLSNIHSRSLSLDHDLTLVEFNGDKWLCSCVLTGSSLGSLSWPCTVLTSSRLDLAPHIVIVTLVGIVVGGFVSSLTLVAMVPVAE